MMSWRISKYLDNEQHQLFYGVVQTEYMVDGYICACGHETILLRASFQDIEYRCPECDNTCFYDANLAHKSFEHFISIYPDETYYLDTFDSRDKKKCILSFLDKSTLPLEYDYVLINDGDKIVSSYRPLSTIPKEIDYARGKIISQPIDLYALTLYKDGSNTESYCMQYDHHVFTTLRQNLNTYIQTHQNIFNIPISDKNTNLNYQIILFFGNYPWLKEFDFYFWEDVNQFPKEDITIQNAFDYLLKGRNEKSIKKGLYQNYQKQLQQYHYFKTTLINTILGTIKDPNFVAELLNRDLHCQGITLDEEQHLKQLILFLQKHYSEKQIVSFLKELDDTSYLTDLLREFIFIGKDLDELFKRPKCTLVALHDAFVKCSHYKYYKQIFQKNITYHSGQEKAEASVLNYDIKLPYNGAELFDWAEGLHNCISGYFDAINNNHTTIYGFFLHGKIEFAVEITDGVIRQASGISNGKLSDAQNEVLKTWFHRFIRSS